MKKSLLLNFVTIVSLFAFASCADDNSDYVQPTVTIEGADEYGTRTLEFSNKVGSQQVEITANGDWFIRIPDDASWLTVTPSEGTASDKPISVTVDVKLNESRVRRHSLLYVMRSSRRRCLRSCRTRCMSSRLRPAAR